ncbi:MAG: hypothetical protein CL680_02060 [Blastomonas sp.]|nr:hypothetical protein [Blastomonas sp.]
MAIASLTLKDMHALGQIALDQAGSDMAVTMWALMPTQHPKPNPQTASIASQAGTVRTETLCAR